MTNEELVLRIKAREDVRENMPFWHTREMQRLFYPSISE